MFRVTRETREIEVRWRTADGVEHARRFTSQPVAVEIFGQLFCVADDHPFYRARCREVPAGAVQAVGLWVNGEAVRDCRWNGAWFEERVRDPRPARGSG